jgi:putative peptidoglycan lipid II flippase
VVQEVVPTDEELIGGAAVEAGMTPGAGRRADEALGRPTAIMSIGVALSRITGLLRVSATLAALGVGVVSDTYNAANTTPNIVYELILGGILTSIFVPVFVDWKQRRGRDEAWAVAQRMLTLTLVVLAGVALAVAILAPWIMRLYLSASTNPDREAQIRLGAYFLRWFIPQIVFYGVGAVATGVLQTDRRFAAAMFAPILNNLAVIATMVAFAAIRPAATPTVGDLTLGQRSLLAAGTTLGVVAMTIALWPSLRRLGFRWRLRFDWRHPAVAELLRLARWTVVYVVANQVAYLVVIVLNTRIEAGGYTAYSQAFLFFLLPHSIFAVSIFTALLPGMAERSSAGRMDELRELWSRGVRATHAVILPAALGYLALSEPIVRLLAQYGAVDDRDVVLIARVLQGFAVGLPFFSVFQLLTRTFYAMQDAKTPALVNVAAGAINVGANLVFAFALGWGVPGLALGHAASYLFASTALLLILRRRLGGVEGPRIVELLARVLPASILCGATALGVAAGFAAVVGVDSAGLRFVQVLLAVGSGLLVFFLTAFIFGIREVDDVRRAVVRRIRG